jgi:amino acid transporter
MSTKKSFFRSIKVVAWSFLGIRKRSAMQEDMEKIEPLHVVLVGLISGLLFVIGLIVVVNLVVAK